MSADPAAVQLATQLTDLIRGSNLKPGDVVASEQDLRARHVVGRSILRQAVRILDERGVATMKRGAGGGLIVSPPDPRSAGRALAIVLESRMKGPHALERLLKATDTHVFLTSTPRLELVECQRIRKLTLRLRRDSYADRMPAGEISQLMVAIRRLVKDPLAGLAYEVTADYGQDLVPYSVVAGGRDFQRAWWDALLEMVEAQMAGDVAALFDLRRRQLAVIRDSQDAWSAIDREGRLLPPIETDQPQSGGASPAERLARELLRDVRLLDWKPGARIGGAGDLLARYKVTVGTLRQAVRILEQNAVVRMERGRSGGLVVTVPEPAVALKRALDYLAQTTVAPDDLASFHRHLLLEAVSAVCETPDAVRAERMKSVVESAIFDHLGQLSGDDAIEMFLSVAGAIPAQGAGPAVASVPGLHQALLRGDAPLARRIVLERTQGLPQR
ncbi:hypothetical protein KOAAANKH_02198 [Brevundimonas sp. NIBR10]|uniref:GntR family transcriptional regulator n=1 Tax=Brevundimonas sp. NIBR10 TaxID=3015997 RepID=UPI0022F18F73|nr:GntR family transcriptional regulator [Brevundimonas sp. NIBR10]WGM47323.1 hypothetical protein KOAAANKH_02198 [Brevundimonas sp. NIBR10]